MGYFSNGTDGDCYEAQWCSRCIHRDDDKGCPVMLTHVLFSYEEANSKSNAKHMLDMLIPRDGAFNAQCTMFAARPGEENPSQLKLGLGDGL